MRKEDIISLLEADGWNYEFEDCDEDDCRWSKWMEVDNDFMYLSINPNNTVTISNTDIVCDIIEVSFDRLGEVLWRVNNPAEWWIEWAAIVGPQLTYILEELKPILEENGYVLCMHPLVSCETNYVISWDKEEGRKQLAFVFDHETDTLMALNDEDDMIVPYHDDLVRSLCKR